MKICRLDCYGEHIDIVLTGADRPYTVASNRPAENVPDFCAKQNTKELWEKKLIA